MTHRLPFRVGSVLALGLCLGAAGCARPPAAAPAAHVPVSHPNVA